MANFVLQSRTDHSDADLLKEGVGFKARVLADGARARLVEWRTDKALLIPWGYDDNWVGAMVLAITDLEMKAAALGVEQGDSTDTELAGTTQHALVGWVRTYLAAVGQAPLAAAKNATHPAHGWESAAHLSSEAEKLILFCTTKATFPVKGESAADFGARGQALLDAYKAAHAAHAADSVSAESKAVHIAAGLVAFELKRLSKGAKEALPADRAALYKTTPLRSGIHHRHGAAPAPVVPPAPAVVKP